MKPNQIVYAILHGEVTKAVFLSQNKTLDTAYVKINNNTYRVTPDSITTTKQQALTLIGGTA